MLARCQHLLLRPWPRPVLGLAALALLTVGGWLAARHLGAWEHLRAGEAALARRDFAAARQHAGSCLAVWPRSYAAHLLALRAARRAGALDDAEQHLAACQELRPGPGAEITLEWALLRAQRDGLAPIEGYLRDQLDGGPDDPVPILEVLTSELMRLRRLPEAQHYLDLWLKDRPDDPDPLTRRGWVREHLFDQPGALADYQRALELAPGDDNVRLRAAEIQARLMHLSEALEQFESLRGRHPDNPEVVLGLVRCLRLLGRADEARRRLDAPLADLPADAQLLHERGRLAMDAGQVAQAESWLRRAADLAPHDRQINYSLYGCLERLGKTEAAKAVSERLKQIEDDEVSMRRLMQEVLLHPDDADRRRQIGEIFLRNGFTEDGVGWLRTAVEIDPGNTAAHRALAAYYEGAGQAELAARHRALAGKAAAVGQAGR